MVRKVATRDLAETLREGLLMFDSDLTIRFANHFFCDIFAVARGDAGGQKLHELGTDSGIFPNSALRSRLSF